MCERTRGAPGFKLDHQCNGCQSTLLTDLEGSVLGCDDPADSIADLPLGWR